MQLIFVSIFYFFPSLWSILVIIKHCDRLHMVTWNVATAEPPEDVTSLLQLDVQPPTDLYVIG